MLVVVFLTTMMSVSPVTPVSAIRNPLAKAVYRKLMHESEHRCSGHEEWYNLDTVKFSKHIQSKWIQLNQDEQTTNFLEHCYDKSDWILTQLYHSIAQTVLNWFMAKTSINGLLRRGSMFVFSTAHFGELLHATSAEKKPATCACAFANRCPCLPLTHRPPAEDAPPDAAAPLRLGSLLDLGAGDGEVTANMAPYFDRVYATETSRVMQWRLKEKGYTVLDASTWDSGTEDDDEAKAPQHYDVIACLNLLDRCSKPLALLHQIRARLKPVEGRLVVALVLPFAPYVEFGPLSPEPEERLLVDGDEIEEQINSLVDNVFAPIGFALEALTRLPYLCEGDLCQAFYVLEDVVFVFRRVDVDAGGEKVRISEEFCFADERDRTDLV